MENCLKLTSFKESVENVKKIWNMNSFIKNDMEY